MPWIPLIKQGKLQAAYVAWARNGFSFSHWVIMCFFFFQAGGDDLKAVTAWLAGKPGVGTSSFPPWVLCAEVAQEKAPTALISCGSSCDGEQSSHLRLNLCQLCFPCWDGRKETQPYGEATRVALSPVSQPAGWLHAHRAGQLASLPPAPTPTLPSAGCSSPQTLLCRNSAA